MVNVMDTISQEDLVRKWLTKWEETGDLKYIEDAIEELREVLFQQQTAAVKSLLAEAKKKHES
jgi:hypothetical protein